MHSICTQYEWDVIGDFKMVAFLMGLQVGCTKFPCLLCLRDSRNTSLLYKAKNWPLRSSYDVGIHNVKLAPLVDAKKMLFPPLHIKLGLIKQCAKKMNSNGEAFKHIQKLFPKLSKAKVKGGIFVGPQVKRLMQFDSFLEKLCAVKRRAWESFVSVVKSFLGNHKVPNFKDIMEELVNAYEKMGCRMSLKLHILHSHIDEFKDNLGDYSEEPGERFHQDVKSFEERYKGQYNENMMGDYIWNLLRESDLMYNRQPCKKILFELFLLIKLSCMALGSSNQTAIFHHIHIGESHQVPFRRVQENMQVCSIQ